MWVVERRKSAHLGLCLEDGLDSMFEALRKGRHSKKGMAREWGLCDVLGVWESKREVLIKPE